MVAVSSAKTAAGPVPGKPTDPVPMKTVDSSGLISMPDGNGTGMRRRIS